MKRALHIVLMLSIFFCFSQKKSSFSAGFESHSQYYLDDSKTGDFNRPNRFRSNNYLRVDYDFLKHFSVGFQLESYQPRALLNYYPGFDKTNISMYHADYKTEKLELTAGYFYEQFGSGLVLRFWEDRQLGINNALRGLKIKYRPTDYLEFIGLYGKQKIGFKVSDGKIFGLDTNLDISNFLKLENASLNLGFSYVGRKQRITIYNPDFKELTNAFSSRLSFAKGNFYGDMEWITKSEDALIIFNQVERPKKGGAFLLNLDYSKKGLGISTTFRKLENMSFYSNRMESGNDYNQAVVNYLPGLTKQYDYLLTNIYVYQAQPQVSFDDPKLVKIGEIGGQADIFYRIKRGTPLGGKYGTKIAMNASFWYGLKGKADYSKLNYDASNLGFGEKYYSDLGLEVIKKWSIQWISTLFYLNQFYDGIYLGEGYGQINADILVGEVSYKMDKGRSLRFELQHLWADKDKRNWVGAVLEFNASTHLGFYVNDIYNYGNELSSAKIHYYNIGASYVKGANRFSMNYGRQRGGILCVGGICRAVPESTGISADITMSF